ncbi:PREDICTED: esterase-like isoform X2 [Nelumbo nucifera]|uniref:Esterase-like isoform X2 n=1 Tax=Nelumbo nucifera TaxID=4432 RepID=A0A1U7YU98_NELNU|nr:PREDICTED: esterase-like isoform X2 [Nelumbo nucifera]
MFIMGSPASTEPSLSLFFSTLIILALILNPAFASRDCNFPAIFNFGDSNSDTGGLSASYYPTQPPNGETFFHMPAGRYSDGRLTIDFMAQSLGLPYLSAYLNSLESNFTHGANFATAASPIRPVKRGGVFASLMPKEEYFSQALYTFDIGQNDLGAGFFGNQSVQEVNASVPDIVSNFSRDVKLIYDLGARSFWIHNTGPIGCLPYILVNMPITASQIDKAGCAAPYNDVAQYFNKKLKEAVVQLRKDLPLAAFTYVDVYSVKYLLISQAEKYGFEHPLVACCGYGGKYNYSPTAGCGDTITVNGTRLFVGSCKRPSVRVIWDGIHYTEAANRWVFDRIVDGKYSDPPLPLRMACHKKAM